MVFFKTPCKSPAIHLNYIKCIKLQLKISDYNLTDMLWTVRVWQVFVTFSCPTFPHNPDITTGKVNVIDSRAHHCE